MPRRAGAGAACLDKAGGSPPMRAYLLRRILAAGILTIVLDIRLRVGKRCGQDHHRNRDCESGHADGAESRKFHVPPQLGREAIPASRCSWRIHRASLPRPCVTLIWLRGTEGLCRVLVVARLHERTTPPHQTPTGERSLRRGQSRAFAARVAAYVHGDRSSASRGEACGEVMFERVDVTVLKYSTADMRWSNSPSATSPAMRSIHGFTTAIRTLRSGASMRPGLHCE